MAICHNGKEGGLVSRRSFLKGGVAVGGAALVGGVLGGCSPQQSGSDAAPLSPVGLPETWDAESDVVIAGFGGAGAAAAWEALNAGATVTILEKQGKAGGSTNICGGLIYMGGGTPTQVAAGFNETTDNYYQYLVAATGPGVSEDHCRVMADESLDLYHWLVDTLGVVFKPGYNPPWPEEENYDAGLSCTGDEFNLDYVGYCEAVPHSHWVEGLTDNLEGTLTGAKNGSGFFAPLQKLWKICRPRFSIRHLPNVLSCILKQVVWSECRLRRMENPTTLRPTRASFFVRVDSLSMTPWLISMSRMLPEASS